MSQSSPDLLRGFRFKMELGNRNSASNAIKIKKLEGSKIGRMTILKYSHKNDKGLYFECQCECGERKICRLGSLKQAKGHGCQKCVYKNIVNPNLRHGGSNTRLYRIYNHMKDRCFRSSSHDFHLYGGRGITECLDWVENFSVFQKWAIENGYGGGLSIDREDVNGNYEPSNCRWVTMKVQQNNKRNTRVFEIEGRLMTAGNWASEKGISYDTAKHYLKKHGQIRAA